ncbi:MAG: potassium channel protein [Desulfobacterales bacterium]|nr:potassium channel protein [Desulfobacterales bacterium]
MDSTRHIILSVLMAALVVIMGTVGYMLFEGWDFLDSAYMTVTTLATVGYGEVHKVSRIGQVYTMVLIIVGVGFFLYVIGAVVQFMVEGRIRTILGRRRLDKKIDKLKNHYIVCGYGRIGMVLCKSLLTNPIDLVVIDNKPDLETELMEDGFVYVSGDATDEAILLKAGIKRAKGLIAVLGTDAENVFLVLTARQLNPDIFIMARATYSKSKSKLKAAGADKVESPYEMGAVNMAQRIIRPTVTSFLDLAFTYKNKDIQMEEIPISVSSKLANIALKDSGIRQQFNLIIIAIKKRDGSMLFNPSFETVICGGDTVIAVGEENNLQKLEKILNSDE